MSGRIRKAKKEKNYTVVPNHVLHSKDLSWKAKGLMCYLLSLSEDWEVYKKDLANRSKDGYDSMIAGWKELEDAGFIETIKIKVGSLFDGYEYIIHETPVRDFPETEIPETVDPRLLSNSIEKVTLEEIDSKLSNAELPSSTTAVVTSASDRCLLFLKKFNEIRIVNDKPSKFRINTQLIGKLKQRLKNYSPEEILSALSAAMKDEYHIKTNFQYVTPEYILRPNILDRFLNIGTEETEEVRGLVH